MDQFASLSIIDAGHNDKNAIGTPGAGFIDLVGLKEKVLAQDGQA
jgi:hypothetical protein